MVTKRYIPTYLYPKGMYRRSTREDPSFATQRKSTYTFQHKIRQHGTGPDRSQNATKKHNLTSPDRNRNRNRNPKSKLIKPESKSEFKPKSEPKRNQNKTQTQNQNQNQNQVRCTAAVPFFRLTVVLHSLRQVGHKKKNRYGVQQQYLFSTHRCLAVPPPGWTGPSPLPGDRVRAADSSHHALHKGACERGVGRGVRA